MNKGLFIAILLITGSLLTGCAPSDNNGLQYMRATVDGKSFTANMVTTSYQLPDSTRQLNITGTVASSAQYISLQIVNYADTPAKYTVTATGTRATYTYNGKVFSTGVTGEVQVTDIGNKTVTGTFRFLTIDSVDIESGSFRATLP